MAQTLGRGLQAAAVRQLDRPVEELRLAGGRRPGVLSGLVGDRTRKVYQLADPVEVELICVSLRHRGLDLKVVGVPEPGERGEWPRLRERGERREPRERRSGREGERKERKRRR